jgi:hypothetical protein
MRKRWVLGILRRAVADIVQSRKRYEADVKRIQEAREGLPAVETILGLDEMQVSLWTWLLSEAKGHAGSCREGDERQDQELLQHWSLG